jgi:type I restriction enzyme S subunit
MAQAIYADFLARIDGNVSKLKELCAFQEGYVNPSQSRTEFFDGEVKWLRAIDINESFIFDTSRTLTRVGFESAGKSAYLFRPDTIAISKSGTIGRLGFVADFMCGNRAVINIAPYDTRLLPFVYLYLKSRQAEFTDLAVGSVQKNLYVPILQELDVLVPEQAVLLDFCTSVAPLFEKWKSNVAENQTLSQTRDTLLPRLMSGELSVAWLQDAEDWR